LRDALALHKDLARKLEALEKKVGVHDAQIQGVFDALRKLIHAPEKPKRRIGFTAGERRAKYRVGKKSGHLAGKKGSKRAEIAEV